MPSTSPLSIKKRALESDSSVENFSPSKKQRPLSTANIVLRSYDSTAQEGTEQESSSDSSDSDSDSMGTEPITLAERPRRKTSSGEDVTDSSGDTGDESDSSEVSEYSTSSSSSSSSEEDEREDEDDAMSETEDNDQENIPDAIPRIPVLQKPQIQRPMDSGLRSRLSSFLPALKAANEDLQGNIAAGRGGDIVMDNADGEKGSQYIEMDLGLGVLEENASGDSDTRSSSSSSVSDDEEQSDTNGRAKETETNVMGRLMGNKSKTKRNAVGIEEIGQQ